MNNNPLNDVQFDTCTGNLTFTDTNGVIQTIDMSQSLYPLVTDNLDGTTTIVSPNGAVANLVTAPSYISCLKFGLRHIQGYQQAFGLSGNDDIDLDAFVAWVRENPDGPIKV